jgi:mannonate dehydratase
MQMTFRWFGPDDPIPLANIRQIPGVTGIVTALYDVPVGAPWPKSSLERIGEMIDRHGMRFAVVESIPVHEDIKLGRPTRDRLIDDYCASVHAMGALGVPVLCYNFMPIFDWTRTDLAEVQADGSTALSYDQESRARLAL